MPKEKASILNRILRVLGYSLLILITLLLLLWAAIQFPAVQNPIVDRVSRYLSERIESPFEIDHVEIDFFNRLRFEGVYIEDLNGDTLLYASAIEAQLSLFAPLQQQIEVKDFRLESAVGKLYRGPDSLYNYQFIIDAFASGSTDTTSSAPWTLGLSRLQLDRVRFQLVDSISRTQVYTRVGQFDGRVDELDLQGQRLAIDDLQFSDSYASISTRQLTPKNTTDAPPSDPMAFPFTGWQLSAGTLGLEELAFSYDDFAQAPAPKGQFDPARLNIEDINLHAQDFSWDSTTLRLQLQQLGFRELNGFKLNELSGSLSMGQQQIQLQDLQIQTDSSRLAPSQAVLTYDTFADLSDFVSKVMMDIDLRGGQIQLGDIQYWSGPIPYLRQDIQNPVRIDGRVKGRVDQLNIDNLDIRAGRSTRLTASGFINGLPDTEQLQLDIELRELRSSYQSLQKLLRDVELPPGLDQLGRFSLQTRVKGRVDSLLAAPLRLRTASATSFDGRAQARGLPDMEQLKFQIDIDSLQTGPDDIKAFAPSPLPVQLDPMGTIRYRGQISGTAYIFTVKGQLETLAGSSSQDASITFTEDYSNATYEGDVAVNQLALGAILGDSTIGNTSFQLQVNGQGLTLDDLQTELKGNIFSLVYNQYEYKDIELDGQLESRQFDGQLQVEDPNFAFYFDGLANLNDSIPEFRFTATLDTANLQQLNLYDSPLYIHTNVEVELTGGQLDQLEGIARLQDFHISDDINHFDSDLISLEARKQNDSIRQLQLDSDFLKARINGQYQLSNFSAATIDFLDTFFPIKRLLNTDTTSTDSLFSEPAYARQNFDFQLQMDEPTRLTRILLPELEQLDTLWIDGAFRGRSREIRLNGMIPAFAYSGTYLDSIALNINGNPQEVTARLRAKAPRSESQVFARQLETNAQFYRDSLQLQLSVKGDSSQQKLLVNTLLSPSGNQRLQLRLLPPFFLNRKQWNIPADHRFIFDDNYLYADNIRLSRNEQAIYAQSKEDSTGRFPPVNIGFERFKIQELTKLASFDADYLSGFLQGYVQLSQPDSSLVYALNLTLEDLTVDKEPLGQLQVQAQPNRDGSQLSLDARLSGAENDLRVNGKYGIADGTLNFTTKSNGLQLAPIDFFSLGSTKESRGQLTADLKITGNTSAPKVVGQLGLDSASTFVDYLQTRFMVPQHTIQLTENQLSIGQMNLVDNKGRTAILSGRVEHEQFNNIRLMLDFDAPSFLVLDTKSGDNELFYGKVLVRADAKIRGPLELPKIDITTTTLPGTAITALPLSEEEAIVQEDFIIYGRPAEYRKDTTEADPRVYQTNTTGYDLSLRLNLTPDAQITAIIDPATGDKLTAKGNANLLVEMNPNGQLTTVGTITLTSGSYFLNYEGIVKRSFRIQEGSTVYVPGDPLDSRFDITAIYETETAVYALIQNEAQSLDPSQEQAARRRQDIQVIMRMEGTLSAPDISFELRRGSSVSGNIAEIVEEKFNRLQEDENELNKQVFGLLLFNSFITTSGGGDLATAGENIALSSVSSLVTNQLNRLASQYVEGVDINVGVDSYVTDQTNTAVTEVELGLSKQLFDDRLSVEVGGNLGVSENNNQSSTAIAGNFLLEYKLTEDGRYRVRIFRRPDYDVFTDGIRTGASLIYKKSFGEIKPDSTQTTKERDD